MEETRGMGDACLLSFLKIFPAVQSFQNYIFLNVLIVLSSGSYNSVLLSSLSSFHIFTWLMSYNSPTSSDFASFWKLSLNGSGSAHLQMLHTEKHVLWNFIVDIEGDFSLFWHKPLLTKCEFFNSKAYAFISSSSASNVINAWCTINESKMDR